ncbi:MULTISPECIES: 1-phosphofructokinase [unclassified Vibrio]|uniref:Phosphofructokinase n=1 Tax=Vibrio sp. HB236076 TaxID=3232307 RepID=A0AB39HGZ3_9VIBR|nr:1-phosphofructokinase [Vibrio sp. HB161653]MDP5253051.1 1-phosphofructokinase [Vibrio sp. HB161653]
MTDKVVTITLNPALDLTGELDTLTPGAVNLVNRSTLHPAGKGVNVAKVLCELGAKVTVTGFLGRENRAQFDDLFQSLGLHDAFIEVDGATRVNVKLVDKERSVSDINFPGASISQADIARFETTLFELAKQHEYFVIAGSLPPGVSPQQCAKWIERLQSMGKKVVFDSSRAALLAGIEAKPWLIKPNDEELAFILDRDVNTSNDLLEAIRQLNQRGVSNVIVSRGEQGLLGVFQGQLYQAKAPVMPVESTVGAGDTLVAGLTWACMQVMPVSEGLAFATALSALAVTQVGVGIKDFEQLTTTIKQTQVTALSPTNVN